MAVPQDDAIGLGVGLAATRPLRIFAVTLDAGRIEAEADYDIRGAIDGDPDFLLDDCGKLMVAELKNVDPGGDLSDPVVEDRRQLRVREVVALLDKARALGSHRQAHPIEGDVRAKSERHAGEAFDAEAGEAVDADEGGS